jgi:hypothetical protein
MAKKPREGERAKPREPATRKGAELPWDAHPFDGPEETRTEPLEEDPSAPLELPPFEEPTGLLTLPPLEAPKASLVAPPRGAGKGHWGEDEGPSRTHYSTKAALLAHILREKFQHRSFGVAPPRVLRIDEPEGPSTAGGRLARQPLSLVAQGDTAPGAPCGWVDTAKGEAQLRGYELVAARYASRHGVSLDLTPEEYDGFLDTLVEALMAASIKVRVFVPEPASSQVSPRTRPSPRRRAAQLLALALVFALGVLVGRLLTP